MKVLAVNGSPRKDGNTRLLLEKALEPIKEAGIETEIFQLGGQAVRGCMACGKCAEMKNKQCVITTDCINECMTKMFEADAVLLGSPTYFSDMTSELKAFIDRAGYVGLANGGLMRRKIGAAVVAVRRGGATNVMDNINKLFLISEMIVPGSTYWNFAFGRNKGEAANDDEGLRNMHNLGSTVAWLLNSLNNK